MAEEEVKVVPERYKMPHVKIGDWVLYHSDKQNPNGLLALVTLVAVETVTMSVAPSFATVVCRYSGDPLLKTVQMAYSNCWSEWPQQVAINELIELLPAIKKMCVGYTKQVVKAVV